MPLQNRTVSIISLILFVGSLTTAVVGQLVYETKKSYESKDNIVTTTMEYTDDPTMHIQEEPDCVCTPFNLCKNYDSDVDGEKQIDIR